jgi:hypothetical protein
MVTQAADCTTAIRQRGSGQQSADCNCSQSTEYVILDDFLVFYPRYTRALPGVFQKSRIFHILNKSAIT